MYVFVIMWELVDESRGVMVFCVCVVLMMSVVSVVCFFFKQKTAYEI
mgnify:CR=1 FL=1